MVWVLDTKLLGELINVLEQENRVYDSILKISQSKTNIIVEGKVSELENIVKLEQSLVLQMGRLEDMREKLVEKLSVLLNLKPSEITVSELMKHIKSDEAQRLKACQDTLAGTVKELKNTNELNSKLIKNSLDFINFSINLISTTDAGSNNYGNTGQVNDGKRKNFFDMKL
ncbi:MAG: flagellar protein FlgN [Clostridia bacterium]|nr:flagellar protein FlgN [Clostridia bacterium]